MQAPDLYRLLRSFALLSNKRALAQSYKVLHLTPTHVRGHAPFGIMEVEAGLGIEQECFVDAERFLQVLASLPGGADLSFTATDNKLEWYCEDPDKYFLKGHLACITEELSIPSLPWQDRPQRHFTVDTDFGAALELAALGCGTQAYLSVGLYGITIANQSEGLIAYASDNHTLASARLGDYVAGFPEAITLAPDALALLADVTSSGSSSIAFTNDMLYCEKPSCRLVIGGIAPLKVNLRDLAAGLQSQQRAMPLARDTLTQFIRRVEALAEQSDKAKVTIEVSDGATRLDYDDGKSFTAEMYLIQSEDHFDVAPIQLEPRRIFKALAAADKIVFDYVDTRALVLRGPRGFMFAVHTKRE